MESRSWADHFRIRTISGGNDMDLWDQIINEEQPPVIIAEMSANHNQSLEVALQLTREVAQTGATAIKLQTYRADTLTLDCDRPEFQITDGPWAGQSLYELYRNAEMPWDWHGPIFELARKLDLGYLSSPFDHSAVDLLEEHGVPMYKIASPEIVDKSLIQYVASKRKPIIISTGMASFAEIANAIDWAIRAGSNRLVVLHCVSAYPTPTSAMNLKRITQLQESFPTIKIGLSDHSISPTAAIAATALGVRLIEKHVTLDRNLGGPDAEFSLEPNELRELVDLTQSTHKAVFGTGQHEKKIEEKFKIFRRSIYLVKNIRKGETLTADHIQSVRPSLGLAPKDLERVIGKNAKYDIPANTPLTLVDFL